MSQYNPLIHHRRSIRLKGYDYSQAGLYFITICCYNRKHLFGSIVDGQMILNVFGQVAYKEWLKTPELRPNVELGEFVIMPNHLHGIIKLSPTDDTIPLSNTSKGDIIPLSNTSKGDTIPLNNTSKGELHSPHTPPSQFRSPSNTIGAIVRGYKSAVTKQLNSMEIGCVVWQRNYYENIIRSEESYLNISNYILKNPAKWKEDQFYK